MARWRDSEMARWLFLATEYTEYTERSFTKRKRGKEKKRFNGEWRYIIAP
jgi:hypothetical protein